MHTPRETIIEAERPIPDGEVRSAALRAAGRAYAALERSRWDNGKIASEYAKRTLAQALRDGTVHYFCACFEHSAAMLAELERELPGCAPSLVCKFGRVSDGTKPYGHGWSEFTAGGKRWSLDQVWGNCLHLSPFPVPRDAASRYAEIPVAAFRADLPLVAQIADREALALAEEYFRRRVERLTAENTPGHWEDYLRRAGDPKIPYIS